MSRIKMFAALPLAHGVSKEYFHDHWRHPHGTWGKRISTIQRYVQSHRIDTPHLGDEQHRYEGVCEIWFDGKDDCAGLGSHHVYQQYLVSDEPKFIDMTKLRFTFADEEILMSGPDPVERIGSADFAWREDRQPVTVKIIQLIEREGLKPWDSDDDLSLGQAVGALRHVRARPNPILHPAGQQISVTPLATAAPDEGKLIGVRELWWPTYSAFQDGVLAAPEAWRTLVNRPGKATTMLFRAERML